MRRALIAFALGVFAAIVAEVLVFVAVAIAAEAHAWTSFTVGRGAFVLIELRRTAGSTTTTFGPGMAFVALAAGVLNAAGAAFLARHH